MDRVEVAEMNKQLDMGFDLETYGIDFAASYFDVRDETGMEPGDPDPDELERRCAAQRAKWDAATEYRRMARKTSVRRSRVRVEL